MNQVLRPLLVLFAFLTLLTGLAYPLLVTGIGRVFFSQQASGSLVMRDGVPVGSSLIGQSFQDPKYFWGRLSATSPMPNNGVASTGSNLGPTNPALIDAVRARADALRATGSAERPAHSRGSRDGIGERPRSAHQPGGGVVPSDARGAGRHRDVVGVRRLVLAHVEPPQFGVFGEPRVNVLLLNLALDRAQ